MTRSMLSKRARRSLRVIAGDADSNINLHRPAERARWLELARALGNGREPELVPGLGHMSIFCEAVRRLR